jgi:hypothetical protein
MSLLGKKKVTLTVLNTPFPHKWGVVPQGLTSVGRALEAA